MSEYKPPNERETVYQKKCLEKIRTQEHLGFSKKRKKHNSLK